MKKLLPAFTLASMVAMTAMATTFKAGKVLPVVFGTHAPKAATLVWRVATKGRGSSTAVPVAFKPGTTDTVVFLTAGHVSGNLGDGAVVESLDAKRKLLIVGHAKHPAGDIGVLYVKLTAGDAAPIEFVALGVDVELEPGLSLFVCGYPGPLMKWFVARGFQGMTGRVSASIFTGMSGGGVMLNDGRLVGICWGFLFSPDLIPAHARHHNAQGCYTPLAGVRPWLVELGIIPE